MPVDTLIVPLPLAPSLVAPAPAALCDFSPYVGYRRPTEFGMNQVLQPFDSGKFNFTKVRPEEVIFRFCEADKDSTQ
uniref:GDPGP1-like N-terminal domain-containing protein n=1 Tax=Setaria viridis TaxID=4556 RepID=A0A4U6ULL7_SETVI|nr:hypothetical protein SEVIR_5G356800v2 [Setaria viridis]